MNLTHLTSNLLLQGRIFCLSQVSTVCMTGVIPTFCSINQFNTRELRVPFHQSAHCPFLLFPLLSTTIPRTINSSSVTYELYKNNQINLCENFVSLKSWAWVSIQRGDREFVRAFRAKEMFNFWHCIPI